MHKNKSQHSLLLNRQHIIMVSPTVATTRWKVIAPLSVTVLVHQKRSRGFPKRSCRERRAERRPDEGSHLIKFEKCLTTSMVNFSQYTQCDGNSSLPTTLRFEHTAHVRLLTPLPSSLTPVQPVTSTLTMLILYHLSPPLLDLSMESEMAAGLLKVVVKANYLLNCLLAVAPVSSYRVHALCQTLH